MLADINLSFMSGIISLGKPFPKHNVCKNDDRQANGKMIGRLPIFYKTFTSMTRKAAVALSSTACEM